ncbi:MAG TPA: SDR family oxidoreductase [Candidatus Limnocylindrales bacterium]|nr:SDR family oxidoreductase [Candidatus Limnocylindrales bacterium]
MTDRLTGRMVLVTGSTGIAAATAERAAREGASVFVVSRAEDHAQELAERLPGSGWIAAELTDEGAVGRAVDAALERFGRIDAVFSAAGGSGRRFGDGPIHAMTGDAWDATLALNLRTHALVCSRVVRQMREQPVGDDGTRGSILLLGSVLATSPVPELFATHAYAAAKAGLTGLMTTMAATYVADRIRVNMLVPSLTDTPMAARAASDPAILEYARRKQPLSGPLLDPDEIAKAAIFFLSAESRAVTGQSLSVDGGWSIVSTSA